MPWPSMASSLVLMFCPLPSLSAVAAALGAALKHRLGTATVLQHMTLGHELHDRVKCVWNTGGN